MNREEQALISVVIAVSGAMVIGSFRYGQDVRYLPQIAGIATIFLGISVILNDRLDILSQTEANLVDQVQNESDIEENLHDTDGGSEKSKPNAGMADSGEFRIDQPLLKSQFLFIQKPVTNRAAVAMLLILYSGLAWLLGIFISSVTFLLLYGKVVNLRRRVLVSLLAFTVGSLLFFGMWLETPLFRPGHQLFDLPEVSI